MDSDDYSTDDTKRKRGTDIEEADIFTRSKKVARTPDKTKKSENKLDKLMVMMQTLMQDVKDIKDEQKAYKEEIQQLKIENDQIRNENKEIRKEIKEIKTKMDKMEKEKRKNNIVIHGIEINSEKQEEQVEEIKNFMKNKIGVETQIKNLKKIRSKICLVELGNNDEKRKVMQNKNKLKNIRDQKIYINDDLTKNEREIQKKIVNAAKEEKRKGKKVKIGLQRLIIEDKKYKWNDEKDILEEIPTKN